MIDAKLLLDDLRDLLPKLEDDLRARCRQVPEVDAPLREHFDQAKAAGRTAQAYEVWRDEQITQAAVAWVLGCVFVRFCEDNALVDPPRISGPLTPSPSGRGWPVPRPGEGTTSDHQPTPAAPSAAPFRRALDEHQHYFQQHPTHSDREYLQFVFTEVARLPAMRELFDKKHNPLWSLGVSGDGATLLLEFWQKRDAETGGLIHDFTDPPGMEFSEGGGTRFLGDLYQDLSASARKKYALLQTPLFVEEFILDRTLTPAIAEFGFKEVRLIDPACGSGHFLLGAFARLFKLWAQSEPAANPRVLAQKALDAIHGVDLNPFAVAIARFRLLVVVLQACDIGRLDQAPAFTIKLACGDSLLHGERPSTSGIQGSLDPDDQASTYVYETEDRDRLLAYLKHGQYHAVVANPPYITPKEAQQNANIRARYSSCHMKYALSVPFMERTFDLAIRATPENGQRAGFTGQITSNSFMKREFGKKLVESHMRHWDLSHVIDTAGAYIPGHGTPTVIILGRNREPVTSTVRAVMGIRGEPATPADPARGLVWTAIVRQIDQPGSQSEFISVGDTPRESFQKHPWSIGGGGAADVKDGLDEGAEQTLGDIAASIGITSFTLEDDIYLLPASAAWRYGLPLAAVRHMVVGDIIRDWSAGESDVAVFPYDKDFRPAVLDFGDTTFRYLWLGRTCLANNRMFGGRTKVECGLRWYEFGRLTSDKLRTPMSIVFGFVATHNHFVLDHGGSVFKQSAPVIKLPADADEDQHLGLLGLLNSSVACFWMKQVVTGKHKGDGGEAHADPAYQRFEFDGTKLQRFPLPVGRPLILARLLDQVAGHWARFLPGAVLKDGVPTPKTLTMARAGAEAARQHMIGAQEELDWQCYHLYGLTGHDLRHVDGITPCIRLGQRAFEIVLARKVAAGEEQTTWFERHGSTPITEIPKEWPEEYRKVVQCRIDLIEQDHNIALIERPEYKRRWNDEPWEAQEERALRSWLLDRLEDPRHWSSPATPEITSTAKLADRVRQDAEFMQVAALYRKGEDFDVARLVAELVEDQAVPFLPMLRYKETGLRKRQVWEQAWDLQRQEDAIDARTKLPEGHQDRLTEPQAKELKKKLDIPVPPRYAPADFLPGACWRLRGKLDVPKERFVSYPGCQREADPSLPIAWAGWDHLQQAQALANYYMARKDEWGREAAAVERLKPLLLGLLELLPWIVQWHNEPKVDYGGRPGDYYRDFVDGEARDLGLTLDTIRAWTPPAKKGRRRKSKA